MGNTFLAHVFKGDFIYLYVNPRLAYNILSAIKSLTVVSIFFLLITQSVTAQTYDTTSATQVGVDSETQSQVPSEEFVDSDPGLMIMALIMVALMLVAIGVGIVLAVIVLVAIFGLITIGVLSASTLIGIHRKSFASGFKTFVVLMSGLGGVGLCALVSFVVNLFTRWCSTTTAVLAGAGFGLVSGLLFGVVLSYILIWFTGFLKAQLTKVSKGTASEQSDVL